MIDPVRVAAEDLVRRAEAAGLTGRRADGREMALLVADAGGRIPSWWADLLVSLPLSGLELGWQAYEPEGDYDGIGWVLVSDAGGLRSESLECYPGLAILESGYVNLGSCSGGSGDPYFLAVNEGADPPVYQVYHDIGTEAEEILAEGRRLVTESLSGFFKTARLVSV